MTSEMGGMLILGARKTNGRNEIQRKGEYQISNIEGAKQDVREEKD